MAPNNGCPECGGSLSAITTRCACGWRKPEIKIYVKSDYRCSYAIAERRCPLPGTISRGFGAWYCRRHYQILSDPQLAKAELIYIEDNYQKIINDEYLDWRKKLFSSNP